MADEIMEELWKIREDFAREHGYDTRRMFDYLRSLNGKTAKDWLAEIEARAEEEGSEQAQNATRELPAPYMTTTKTSFRQRLREAGERNDSLLCVGLDPDPAELSGRAIADFCIAIIDATIDLVCAYKPNIAFYEALGSVGYAALERIIDHVNGRVPVLGDAKRNDIGNSARFYAQGLFETMGFDAVTVNPFLGRDSLQPFLDYEDKGVFILCRTSNPGGADIQGLNTAYDGVPMPLYEAVAHLSKSWDTNDNIGLVTGATYPAEAQRIREICPDMPFLVPGVGTQGGELESALSATLDANGSGVLVNSSRGILYASNGPDFADTARAAAENLRAQIQAARASA